jgi:hypothetical protein
LSRLAPVRLLAALALAVIAHADLIDRIAVSVGNRVITQSDLERQIRVVAFQNGVKPDLSPANRRAMANKMIQQKLIQLDLETSRYPQPIPAELTPAVEEFKKTHFMDSAEYQRALAAYGITEQDLLDLLVWQRTLLNFIEIRFETGVQVTEAEVDAYAREKKMTTADAERALISQRADEQADQWLRDVRRRTEVIVHEEVFQ